MAKKVDLSQAQAEVLEVLVVNGNWDQYTFHQGTVRALINRGYIEMVSRRTISVSALGVSTLRSFPYADKHIELIVDLTGNDAATRQVWRRSDIVLHKIKREIEWLGKVNTALSNGQPPSTPTPKKPIKTPVKPKPMDTHIRRFTRRTHSRSNLPRYYATGACGECGARSQLFYQTAYRLFCTPCGWDTWFGSSLPPACNCEKCKPPAPNIAEETPVKPKPVRKVPIGKWELFTRQGGVCPVCEKRMQWGNTWSAS